MLPRQLEHVFGSANSANDLLNIILRERHNLYRYVPLISTALSPAIGDIRKSVAVFIDNVDEFMDRHVCTRLRDSNYAGGQSLGALSERVWVSAQLGLIEAAKAINARNTHIKIFASIRLEAFSSDNSSTHTQARDVCTILKYSDAELKSIFEGNIRLVRKDELRDPKNESLVEQFLGLGTIPHPFAKGPDGSALSEGAFRYLLRHTLRRPRELLWMGMEIGKIPVDRRGATTISRTVNKVSAEILQQYKNEIVPFWDEDESSALLSTIKANVITKAAYDRIVSSSPACADAFTAFYRRGLLGAVHSKDWGDGLIQTFLPAAEHLFNESETLPSSTHYLLHPCLEEELTREHGTKFKFDQRNIIGYDYAFVATDEVPTLNGRKRQKHTLRLRIKDRSVSVDRQELNPKLALLHFGLLLGLAGFFGQKRAAFVLKDLMPACYEAYSRCLNEVRKREPEFAPENILRRMEAYQAEKAQRLSNHLQALCEALSKGKPAQSRQELALSAVVCNHKAMSGFCDWKITVT